MFIIIFVLQRLCGRIVDIEIALYAKTHTTIVNSNNTVRGTVHVVIFIVRHRRVYGRHLHAIQYDTFTKKKKIHKKLICELS